MRSLAKLAVTRFVTFLMIYIGALGVGLFSLTRLPIDMFPDITFPLIGVITTYEGASPEDIENLITRPVEEAVAAVEGVEEVNAASRHGVSRVFVEFDWGTDLDQAETDIRRNLDFIREILPDDATEPLTFAFDPSMQPIYILAVYGPYDQAELRRICERQFEPQLERLPGVAQAFTQGGLTREIQVRFDPDELLARGVTLEQVVGALRAENLQLPGGTVREGGREISIITQGFFEDVDEIGDVVVGVANRIPIRLRDVAEVVDTYEESNHIIRNNGRSGVMLMVRKQSDANTVETAAAVRAAMPEILSSLPPGIQLGVIFDQSMFITDSVSNLSVTAVLAFVFAFLVLLVFLRDVRGAGIVGAAIPVSVIVTFTVMYAAGVTLNIISMAGLALAIGMLVDNSIVVLENIYRHFEMGKSAAQAAVDGASEVAMAITASTLTTVFVFAPVLFVEGVAGVMFRDMALTICFSLTASLVVAITLVPMLASRLLTSRSSKIPKRKSVAYAIASEAMRLAIVAAAVAGAIATGSEAPIPAEALPRELAWLAVGAGAYVLWQITRLRGLRWGLAIASEKMIDAIRWAYNKVLPRATGAPVVTVLLFVAALVGSGVLLYLTPRNFFPRDDDSIVFIRMNAAVGTSAQQTDAYYRQAEKIIVEHTPEAVNVATEVGQGEGFMNLFSEGLHSGLFRLKLRPIDERERSAEQIEDDLRRRLGEIPGVTVSAFQPFGFGGGTDIEIEIIGHDLEVSRRVGQDVKRLVESLPDAADVEFSLDEGVRQLEVTLDRERMSALGINSLKVNSTVSTFFQGTVATIYREGGDEFSVRVRAPRELRNSRRQLEELRMLTPLGKQVPLATVARVDERLGPVEISRRDQRRITTVTVTNRGRDLAKLTGQIKARLDRYEWPDGFSYDIGGTAEDMQESFFQLGIAMLAAAALVYMVMASQFESLLSPFVIFLTIVFTPIGVGVALFLTDTPVSVVGLIGAVMLAGVVVNNSIVLVDSANQRCAAGLDAKAAIEEAGRTRLRPILMTALTTILGLLPLALGIGSGAESWSPLARVVIGGLIGSTAITLFFVPVAYKGMVKVRPGECKEL